MSDHASKTTKRRCSCCGEVFSGPHDCGKAIEARALFEAAKRANNPDSGIVLADLAYQAAKDAENV
jgi:hypothetical protein